MSTDWLRLPSRSVEKFSMATRHLATSTGSLGERLRGALIEISTLQRDEFPEDEAQHRWQAILDRINREPASPDGTIHSAIADMSEEEATELANEITWARRLALSGS